MRDFVTIIALAFAAVYAYAEHRGIELIDLPGVVRVDPAPGVTVPGSGIRVLFVRPGGSADKLPAGHENLPSLGSVRGWMKSNATYRNWVEGTDDRAAPDDFKVMMKIPRTTPRWMVIANGPKVRYSGPWPATGDEAVKLLESCK